jgi:hypothetical protein
LLKKTASSQLRSWPRNLSAQTAAQLAAQLDSCRTARLDLRRRATQNAIRPPATRNPIVDQIENRITRECRSRNGDKKCAYQLPQDPTTSLVSQSVSPSRKNNPLRATKSATSHRLCGGA